MEPFYRISAALSASGRVAEEGSTERAQRVGSRGEVQEYLPESVADVDLLVGIGRELKLGEHCGW